MLDVGNRLRDERKRLNLNQEEFASIGGVTRRAQTTYENGRRVPDARYLSAVAGIGVDVQYVLTGARSIAMESSSLSPDERALLDNYRHSHREDQAALRRMGLAMSKPTPTKRNGTTGSE
ncbi:helix-turn-helix domain-containing protein [Pandoraea commovens]|uniref:helix-turn-helix domain-containing protein n=1 Tax=Pandoraea commovens TaxID=2508289 RepID=UPI001C2D77D5|nr:helix-turn-helix transcriptional regulator [Pandoraea commovens]